MKIGFHSNTGQVSDRVVNGERFLGWQLYHNRPIGRPSREPLCIVLLGYPCEVEHPDTYGLIDKAAATIAKGAR